MAAGLLARQGSEAGTEADIAVRIRAGVVEVQRAKPGIGRIVPIAATDRQALIVDARPLLLLRLGLGPGHPATDHAADLGQVARPYFVLPERKKSQVLGQPHQ